MHIPFLPPDYPGRETPAGAVTRAPHNSSGEREVDRPLAFAVDGRYAAQATMQQARFAETPPRAAPPPGIPDSRTTTEREPSPTRAVPHYWLAPFCSGATPKARV